MVVVGTMLLVTGVEYIINKLVVVKTTSPA